MGRLEERFFNKNRETLVKADDERAEEINEVLKKTIIRGYFEGGKTYEISFDGLYG